MNTPLASIIIPSYNRANLLKLCIDSVLAQTYQNWEIIIIDNFSTDCNESIALSYNDSRIRLYKNANNGIIAVSRNKGISLAKGEIVYFLDSDDIWTPDKLEKTIPYFTKYDLVYHDMIIYHYIDDKIKYLKRLKGRTLKGDKYLDALLNGNPCINSSLGIKRCLIEKTGNICEDKRLVGVEDFDYFLRLIQNAHPLFLPEVLGYYYEGISGISNTECQVNRLEELYTQHLQNINDQQLKKEIKHRISYRQARIYQIHGNKTMAAKKFA